MTNDAIDAAGSRTGDQPDPAAGVEDPARLIQSMRSRIDDIDSAITELWRERATLSREIGAIRVAAGETRLVLSSELEVMERFRKAIGADGTSLAMLVLRAGRDPLGSG